MNSNNSRDLRLTWRFTETGCEAAGPARVPEYELAIAVEDFDVTVAQVQVSQRRTTGIKLTFIILCYINF